DIRTDTVVIVNIPVDCRLVSIVYAISIAAFRKKIRGGVRKILKCVAVLIVSSRTLREVLRGNELTSLDTELHGVLPFSPGQRLSQLISVLGRALGSIGVR